MTRNFKVLGLALCAFFAMSAFVAQSAFAVDHTFEATKTPVTLTGDDHESIHVLQSGEVAIECTESTFVGKGTEAKEDKQTLVPTYKGCKLKGVEVEVKNEGCSYTFDSDTTAGGPTGESGTVQITCPGAALIKVIGPGCTIDFGAQGPLHGIKYSVSGDTPNKHEDLTVEAHVTGIEYNATNNGCVLLGITKGVHNDGVYKGNSTVRGYEPELAHVTENQIGLNLTTP